MDMVWNSSKGRESRITGARPLSISAFSLSAAMCGVPQVGRLPAREAPVQKGKIAIAERGQPFGPALGQALALAVHHHDRHVPPWQRRGQAQLQAAQGHRAGVEKVGLGKRPLLAQVEQR
jgi:hypothetical protein